MLLQVADSLLDSLYFIKLKTEPRVVQVRPVIQIIQAVLLFTCESEIKSLSTLHNNLF